MTKLWAVDPPEDWLTTNRRWLIEANLPDAQRCSERLVGQQCELIAAHDSSHMVHLEKEQPATE